MLSYVLPTRDRPDVLHRTLDALAALGEHDAEIIIADNASREPPPVPTHLSNGIPVHLLRLARNHAAAARNLAAREVHRRSQWIIMLDDDSHPLDLGHLRAVAQASPDTAVIAAEIFLPPGRDAPRHQTREQGGLPEVFIGCGVAVRTHLFNALAGYDDSFDYYAEEYDLAARLINAGHRIELDRRFRVLHEKNTAGRNFSRIVRNLVRNNAWVAQRYAPESERQAEIKRHITRYAAIAKKEHSLAGYSRGLIDLLTTLDAQPRREMSRGAWDRFTGLAACRAALARSHAVLPLRRVAIVARGKNDWAVVKALTELNIEIVHESDADTLVVGTLSPGPMLDAAERLTARDTRRVVLPWDICPDPNLHTALRPSLAAA